MHSYIQTQTIIILFRFYFLISSPGQEQQKIFKANFPIDKDRNNKIVTKKICYLAIFFGKRLNFFSILSWSALAGVL